MLLMYMVVAELAKRDQWKRAIHLLMLSSAPSFGYLISPTDYATPLLLFLTII